MRLCFLGCGSIADRHAKCLSGKADLKFVSRSVASAERLNARHGGSGVYTDLDDALGDPSIDAVVITSPPEYHLAQAIAALSAGKHVLVEKPAFLSKEEGDRLAEASAGRADRVVMVAENYYYKPSLRLLKGWVDDGVIGRPTRALIRKCTGQKAEGWKAAHGSLLEGGIHFVALASGLFGRPADVKAEFPGQGEGQPERHSVLRLTYEDGPDVTLEYAWDTPSVTKGTFQHSWIDGDRGRIGFESNGIYAWVRGKKRAFRFPGFGDLMGYGAMMDDFLGCVESGGEPVSNLQRARDDMGVVFRAYEGRNG